MAWLNANGTPVAMQAHTFQIDLPAEPVAQMGAPNWGAVFAAVFQLISAFTSGNPAAIIAALQALIKAAMDQ
jgi:hypothetical protein